MTLYVCICIHIYMYIHIGRVLCTYMRIYIASTVQWYSHIQSIFKKVVGSDQPYKSYKMDENRSTSSQKSTKTCVVHSKSVLLGFKNAKQYPLLHIIPTVLVSKSCGQFSVIVILSQGGAPSFLSWFITPIN